VNDSADKIDGLVDAMWDTQSQLSALAGRLQGGSSASITHQSSGPILIAGALLAIFGVSLLAYCIGTRSGDMQVAAIRERQIIELTQRVEMLEAYNQQVLKRLTIIEAKEK
jgi:hypothetical protein